MISREVIQKKFRIFIWLSLFVLILEVAGGFVTNSLALFSDAGHVLIDLLALLLAYFAMRLSRRGTTEQFTYGYYRAEILAAMVNAIILFLLTLYIFYESYLRFLSPSPINGPEMFIIAVIGLAANLYVVLKMHGDERENLNVRGAYLHVLSDTISSIGVVVGGGLIIVTGNYIFDPLVSAAIGVFILVNCLGLVRESVRVLMEAVPKNIDLQRVSDDILQIPRVKEIHDLHIWSIASDVNALSAHILIDSEDMNSLNNIIAAINDMLKEKYGITHSVIQGECERCATETKCDQCNK
jgi:cobalt-zinc-cadmium efflux system protein